METSLHRQLKEHYADDQASCEVKLGKFRIDVVAGGELIEIQHGSLAAIRRKIAELTADHRVRVVKPIVVRKQLVKLRCKGGTVVSRRLSPKTGCLVDFFHEMVYFTSVFPHPKLTIDVALVDIEEWRYPGHGRRRRRRDNDFQIQDQHLTHVHRVLELRKPRDLFKLLDARIPSPFDTAQMAETLDVQRWVAQRIAYCLRETGAVKTVGKRGGAVLYQVAGRRVA